MIKTEPIIHSRKLTLCPKTCKWPVTKLLKTCPSCGAFLLYCCACTNKYLKLKQYHLSKNISPPLRPSPCHHFRVVFTSGACTFKGQQLAGMGIAFGTKAHSQMAVPVVDSIDDFPVRSSRRAELCAVKVGLEALAAREDAAAKKGGGERSRVWIVATDSEYVVKGMTDWLVMWKKNDWRTAKGTQPANSDLFLLLDDLVSMYERSGITVGFWHVPSEYNQLADRLAKEAVLLGDDTEMF